MICQLLNIKSLCKEILAKHWTKVKLLQRLMWCFISTRPAVQMSRARFRGIKRMVHYKGMSTANKMVRLSAWAKEDVLW